MKIQVGNKSLTIRKWKGKDKKAFVGALKKKEINESAVMDALVYSCIEENTVLSVDEFRYALSRIRAYSLGEDISIEFYCDDCGTVYTRTFQLKDIITYVYEPLKEIKVDGYTIKLGEIKNRNVYSKLIAEDPLYDLLLRIEAVNGDDAFTLDSLMDMFDDMDVDVLTEILEIWEDAKFKVNDINIVKCTNEECGKETKFKFDELPGFFPASWFE